MAAPSPLSGVSYLCSRSTTGQRLYQIRRPNPLSYVPGDCRKTKRNVLQPQCQYAVYIRLTKRREAWLFFSPNHRDLITNLYSTLLYIKPTGAAIGREEAPRGVCYRKLKPKSRLGLGNSAHSPIAHIGGYHQFELADSQARSGNVELVSKKQAVLISLPKSAFWPLSITEMVADGVPCCGSYHTRPGIHVLEAGQRLLDCFNGSPS